MKKKQLQTILHQIESACFIALANIPEGSQAAEEVEKAYGYAGRAYELVKAAPCLWNQDLPFETDGEHTISEEGGAS